MAYRLSRCTPKALCGQVIPRDILVKTIQLLTDYERVPIEVWPSLYKAVYNEVFDAIELGFEGGLWAYFKELKNTVKIIDGVLTLLFPSFKKVPNDHNNNKINPTPLQEKSFNSQTNEKFKELLCRRARHRLFNDEDLWRDGFKTLQDSNVVISPSPIELACSMNQVKAKRALHDIIVILKGHPNGIKLNELSSKVPVDKRLFGVCSINDMVVQYPEIFYCVESADNEPLLFNGLTHTCLDLDRYGTTNVEEIAQMAVRSGIYHKTLIIIDKADKDGMKISVWAKSMTMTFGQSLNQIDEYLMDMNPLQFFLALSSVGLIKIKSNPKCLNDIRAHLPGKPNLRKYL